MSEMWAIYEIETGAFQTLHPGSSATEAVEGWAQEDVDQFDALPAGGAAEALLRARRTLAQIQRQIAHIDAALTIGNVAPSSACRAFSILQHQTAAMGLQLGALRAHCEGSLL